MPDNLIESGTLRAADEVGGVLIQRVKLVHGADGVNDGDVSGASPLPVAQPPSTAPAAASGANAAATITFAAVAGQSHRLTFLAASYSAAPTGGRLTVADGATTILDLDLTGAGTAGVPALPAGGIQGTANTAMTITLAAGGAGIVGKLSAAKRTA